MNLLRRTKDLSVEAVGNHHVVPDRQTEHSLSLAGNFGFSVNNAMAQSIPAINQNSRHGFW